MLNLHKATLLPLSSYAFASQPFWLRKLAVNATLAIILIHTAHLLCLNVMRYQVSAQTAIEIESLIFHQLHIPAFLFADVLNPSTHGNIF